MDSELEGFCYGKGKTNDSTLDHARSVYGCTCPFGCGESITEFKDCDDCPVMVEIPAGTFFMGVPPERRGAYQGPHEVTIPIPFAVGKFEVTFDEWDACVSAGGCNGYRPHDSGWGRGNRPVKRVSWDDAKGYVSWISRKTGETYRLLSEAEWEYAARAGTTTLYSWGDDIGSNRANCGGCGSQWDKDKTAPVGSFSANAFGLYDMHGNLKEWVQDCWSDPSIGAPSCVSGQRRVFRGGSYDDIPRFLKSGYRFSKSSDFRGWDYGFRVARTLD